MWYGSSLFTDEKTQIQRHPVVCQSHTVNKPNRQHSKSDPPTVIRLICSMNRLNMQMCSLKDHYLLYMTVNYYSYHFMTFINYRQIVHLVLIIQGYIWPFYHNMHLILNTEVCALKNSFKQLFLKLFPVFHLEEYEGKDTAHWLQCLTTVLNMKPLHQNKARMLGSDSLRRGEISKWRNRQSDYP